MITANIVPVWSITSKRVIEGATGSMPISFSAIITCAELDTGKSSHAPCKIARIMILRYIIAFELHCLGWTYLPKRHGENRALKGELARHISSKTSL
jgi:hypothetical protein